MAEGGARGRRGGVLALFGSEVEEGCCAELGFGLTGREDAKQRDPEEGKKHRHADKRRGDFGVEREGIKDATCAGKVRRRGAGREVTAVFTLDV